MRTIWLSPKSPSISSATSIGGGTSFLPGSCLTSFVAIFRYSNYSSCRFLFFKLLFLLIFINCELKGIEIH